MLMGRLGSLAPSMAAPGLTADGLAPVAGGQLDEASAYYIDYAFGGSGLLFEAELPGKIIRRRSWPATPYT